MYGRLLVYLEPKGMQNDCKLGSFWRSCAIVLRTVRVQVRLNKIGSLRLCGPWALMLRKMDRKSK